MRMIWPLVVLTTAVASLACAGSPQPSSPVLAPAATGGALPSQALGDGPSPGPMERQAVQYGYNPILAGGPMYLAQERGYFAEQGFAVEFTPFDSGALMIAPASAGQLDVIAAVPSPSLFNALVRNVSLKGIVAQSASVTTLLLRQDLADSGQVRTLQDLKGKRISFNVEGSPVDYQLRRTVIAQGLALSDFEVVRLSNTDLAAALANSAVDAGTASDPLPLLIEQRGIGVRFLNTADVIGPQQSGLLVAGPGMLGRGDAPPTRFVAAFLRGLRDMAASIHDDKITDPAVLDILSKWTKVPAETIAQVYTVRPDPSGRIDLVSLNDQQEFWVHEGQVPTRADIDQFVEGRFLEAADAAVR
jgi:NitT/TauT family transport system substrate-binding protein